MEYIEIAKVKLNQWNPNKMDDLTYKALQESFEEFGVIDPILVRRIGDYYEVIDGEHRLKIAQSLDMSHIEAVIIDVDDTQAKRLTQIMNRTRGEDDQEKLMHLLDSILSEIDKAEAILGLPLTEQSLDVLLIDLHKKYDNPSTIEVKSFLPPPEDKEVFTPTVDDVSTSNTDSIDSSKPMILSIKLTRIEQQLWTGFKDNLGISSDREAFIYLLMKRA